MQDWGEVPDFARLAAQFAGPCWGQHCCADIAVTLIDWNLGHDIFTFNVFYEFL